MPLKVEMYSPKLERWVHLFEIKPGEKPCVIPDRNPIEKPHAYVLRCEPDNSKSTISETCFGINKSLANGQNSEIKQLGVGKSHEMQIHTYGRPLLKSFRLTHI